MIKKLFSLLASCIMLGSLNSAKAQQALDFDGANDYVSVAPSSGLNNQFSGNRITIEGWYYPTPTGPGLPMLIGESYLGDGNILFCLYQNGTTINGGFYDGAWESASASITMNTWQHIACTYDQTQVTLYINGVAVSTFNTSNVLPAGTEEWRIGMRWDGAEFYKGKMDEVRIWNTARTQAQIRDNMYCSLSGPTGGLVANYTFNQGIANGNNPGITTLNDLTGNSFDGTLNNFTLSGTSSNWVNGFGGLNPNAYSTISADYTTIAVAGTPVTFTATPFYEGGTPSYQWMKNGANVGTNVQVYTDNTLANGDTVSCLITSSASCINTNLLSNKIGITVASLKASLAFDGNNDYITTTLDADADVMPATTWEAWIYPTTNDGNWRMVCSMEDGGWDRFIAMNGGQLWVGVSSTGWNPTSITINTWHHVAVVYTAADVKFYLDGVEYSYGSGEGAHLSNGLFTIGANEAGTQNYQGLLDELHVWNVARSQAEIQQDMGCGFTSSSANLIANYNFNEGTPNANNAGINTLNDLSGNSYNGPLSNFSLNGTNSNWTNDVDVVGALSLSGTNSICMGGSTTLMASSQSNATAYLWSANTLSATTASVTVSPAATSTYVVAATGGCSNVKDSIVVTVIPLPVVSVSGPTITCSGSPVTFTASGASTYTWTSFAATPADAVPSCNLAIGLRKLNSAYTGQAIRLRRSSDNVEQDIGFVGTELDTAAIRIFLGGSQGFCTTMYDQSGSAGDVAQSNMSRQPLYVASGLNGRPVLRFNGGAVQNLFNTINYPAPFTAIYTARQNGPNRARMLTATNNNWLLGWWGGSMDQVYFEGWVTPSPGSSPSDSNPYTYSGTSDGATISNVYRNGIFQFGNGGGLTGPDGIDLGAWLNSGESSDGDFTEVFVFNSVLSASDRQLVENSTGSYYGILSGSITGAVNTFTPTTNSDFIVSATSISGCKNESMVTLTVIPSPTVTSTISSATVCAGTTDVLTAGGANTYTWSSNAGSATTASVSVSPSSSDTYTVTGTGGNGCSNTSAVSVVVNSLPAISVTPTSSAICTGSSDVLTAGAANTYTWSSNAGGATTASVSVSPTSNDTYTVTGTDLNGCINSNTVSVTVNSLPVVSATITSATVCLGMADTLNVSGANTYTWSSNAGSATTASVSVSPIANDTYTVTGTDANGCVNTSTVSVIVNPCSTGINGQSGEVLLTVYPNPGNGVFVVETKNLPKNATLVIYDCIGQIAYSQQVNRSVETVDLKLTAGIYTLRLQNTQGVIAWKRIVIQ